MVTSLFLQITSSLNFIFAAAVLTFLILFTPEHLSASPSDQVTSSKLPEKVFPQTFRPDDAPREVFIVPAMRNIFLLEDKVSENLTDFCIQVTPCILGTPFDLIITTSTMENSPTSNSAILLQINFGEDDLEYNAYCTTFNRGHYQFQLSLFLSTPSNAVQFNIYFTKKGLSELVAVPKYQPSSSKFSYHEPISSTSGDAGKNYTYCVVASHKKTNGGFNRCAIRDHFWKNQKRDFELPHSDSQYQTIFTIKNPLSLKAAHTSEFELSPPNSTYVASCSHALFRVLDFLENDQDYVMGTFAIDRNPSFDIVSYEKYAWKIIEYPFVSIRAVVPRKISFVLNSSAIFYHDFNLSQPHETVELEIIPEHFCIRHLVMTQHKPTHFIPVQVTVLSNSGERLDKFMLKKYEYLNLTKYPEVSSLEPGKSCYDGFKLHFNHKVSQKATDVAIAISVARDESLLPIVAKTPPNFLKLKLKETNDGEFEVKWAVVLQEDDVSYASKFEYRVLAWLMFQSQTESSLKEQLFANLTINVQSNTFVVQTDSFQTDKKIQKADVSISPLLTRNCIKMKLSWDGKGSYTQDPDSVLIWVAMREKASGYNWIFFEELIIPIANSTTK